MYLSEALAVGSAVCIALSSMFVNALNGRVPIMRLTRWQITATFLMTGAAALATCGWGTLGEWQIGYLAASGFFGIVIASTTYFSAIYIAGPRVTALLFSLAAPFALVMGYFAYGETITLVQGIGVALILAGIVIAIGVRRRRPAPMLPLSDAEPIQAHAPEDTRPSLIGIVLGVITALGQAGGSVIARPAMASGVDPFAAMAVRSGISTLAFWALFLLVPMVRQEDAGHQLKGKEKWRDMGLAVAAAFVGTALGMSLLMGALQNGNVGIVSTLSSMTPIVILPMVWIQSGQMPRIHAWGGAALAILGTALVSIG